MRVNVTAISGIHRFLLSSCLYFLRETLDTEGGEISQFSTRYL